MTDVVSKEKRSKMMANIRSKNTKPELLIRRALFALGLRFNLHRRELPGSPDIVFPRKRVAIFVHGCFWHQHKFCKLVKSPGSNSEFWKSKLDGNVRRDEKINDELISLGWRVLTIWECVTRNREAMELLPYQIRDWIEGHEEKGEFSKLPPQ